MEKYEDWQFRLMTFIRETKSKPFQWGVHDCFIFSTSAVFHQTGIDLFSGAVGKYHDEQSAKQFCNENGYTSHIHYIARHLKSRKSTLQTMRGDVVLIRGINGGAALGICQGPAIYAIGDQGLYTLPMSAAIKAFAV